MNAGRSSTLGGRSVGAQWRDENAQRGNAPLSGLVNSAAEPGNSKMCCLAAREPPQRQEPRFHEITARNRSTNAKGGL
jgi:hypothetical protein